MFRYLVGPLVGGVLGYFCAMELDKGDGWLQLGALLLLVCIVGAVFPFVLRNFSHPFRPFGVVFTLGALVWVVVSMTHGGA